jgi:hypothetical protein
VIYVFRKAGAADSLILFSELDSTARITEVATLDGDGIPGME